MVLVNMFAEESGFAVFVTVAVVLSGVVQVMYAGFEQLPEKIKATLKKRVCRSGQGVIVADGAEPGKQEPARQKSAETRHASRYTTKV